MTDRLVRFTDIELEAALVDLAPRLEYPPVGDLASRVGERIAQRQTSPWARLAGLGGRRWPRWAYGIGSVGGLGTRERQLRRGLAIALVALLILAGLAVAARLGVPGIRLIFGPLPATPGATGPGAPQPTISGSSTSPGAPGSAVPATVSPSQNVGTLLDLGELVSLGEATTAAEFPVEIPSDPAFARPDAVYLNGPPGSRRVTVLYWARPALPATGETGVGLLLTEFRASIDTTLFEKVLGQGTTVEPVVVGRNRGFWISGQPHELFYRDPSGQPIYDRVRLAGNVVIWNDGNTTFRLESGLTKNEALEIAASVR